MDILELWGNLNNLLLSLLKCCFRDNSRRQFNLCLGRYYISAKKQMMQLLVFKHINMLYVFKLNIINSKIWKILLLPSRKLNDHILDLNCQCFGWSFVKF